VHPRAICTYTWRPWTDGTINGKKRMHAFILVRRAGWDDNGQTVHQFLHVSWSLEEERIDLRGRWGRCRRGCTLRRTSVVHSPTWCAWMIACRGRRWSVCRLGQVFNGHVITSSCVHHPAEWTTRSYNVERHEDAAATGRFMCFRFELFLLLPHLLLLLAVSSTFD